VGLGEALVELRRAFEVAHHLVEAPPGEIDPVYGFPTGIARDEDGNAEGGVRLPDLHVGRAQYIALDVSVPGLPVNGTSIDLACEPRSGDATQEPRFARHGQYSSAFVRQVNRLRAAGFLLPEDGDAMKKTAARSSVGKPASCATLGPAATERRRPG
jgi:hypothetical protein